MTCTRKHPGVTASAAHAVALFCSCTDTFLEPKPIIASNADDRLTLRGRVCTNPPDPSGFPVKVVFVVDQSGSMCISDPPGAQQSSTFCQFLTDNGIIPPGTTRPARVRAMQQLIQQFRNQTAVGARIELAVVPFETNVRGVWPDIPAGQTSPITHFQTVNDTTLDAYIDNLQNQLGKGTDYQGAMAYTYQLISEDMADVKRRFPAQLPRTRYVVVFLTDGTPYPRCSAIDTPPFAGPYSPEGKWEDSPTLGGPTGYCNLATPTDAIDGFTPATDRNQNYQIFGYVEKLMELKNQFNVGDVRLHTVLLLNEAAMRACGDICQEVYGQYSGVAAADWPVAAKMIARWTLQQMANRGNGVFQEFLDGSIQDMGLGALDYTSLVAPYTLKTLMVQSLRSVPDGKKRVPDSDGDGLPDYMDTALGGIKTSPFDRDSDNDCFDDRFEYLHADQGFIAANDRDTRGCDSKTDIALPDGGTTIRCNCLDNDGDGVFNEEERYLKSHTGVVDSDADGIPDGLEIRYRLDPNVSDLDVDTDGDGIPDKAEYLAGTDPTRPDLALFEREGYQYELNPVQLSNGATCYDFTITNLQLVTPPAAPGVRPGFNLFKLWFAEAPQSAVATDYGEWRAACAWAQYDPPIRNPTTPDLVLQDSNFVSPDFYRSDADYLRRSGPGRCVGSPP